MGNVKIAHDPGDITTAIKLMKQGIERQVLGEVPTGQHPPIAAGGRPVVINLIVADQFQPRQRLGSKSHFANEL